MKRTVSVGIATFNRAEFLKQTVKSIIDQNADAVIEIIIVDQTPDENITKGLKQFFETLEFNIIYITQAKPAVSVARNTIILKAKGDVVLFFDDDVILGSHCIESHLSVYDHEGVKSCIGHIHHRQPAFDIEKLDINNPRNGTENMMPETSALDLSFDGVSISCNQSFDRQVLIELGGFDENFVGGYYEDADLGLRLKKGGHLIAFHPDAMVVHIKAPQGGLRFEAKQPFTEVERLISYALFFIRYPKEYGFFSTLKSILRAGPLRKTNVLHPVKHVNSWVNLVKSFYYANKVKASVKSIIFYKNVS